MNATSLFRPRKAMILNVAIAAIAFHLSGCVATTRSLDPNEEFHYDASYDFSDKKAIVDSLSGSLISTTQVPISNEKPSIVSYGIANETSEHINTGGISDAIRQRLIEAQRFRFINREQRTSLDSETRYQQSGKVPLAERVALGRQLGADYILSGTLRSIEKKQPRQWRLNKRELIYYAMTLELTDLESSEIIWADDVELAREASRPIIGW